MYTGRATRFCCDFCHRGLSKRKAMEIHERNCLMNPDRYCEMCDKAIRIPALLKIWTETGDIDALRHASNGCPMCMFATIKQGPVKLLEDTDFDYHKERDAYMVMDGITI